MADGSYALLCFVLDPLYLVHPEISTFANSEDPDEMQHNAENNAAFHQNLHCFKCKEVLQTKVHNTFF